MITAAGVPFLQRLLDDNCGHALQHVTYIDQSPAMARAAQAMLADHPRLSHTVVIADEEFLPCTSASHDCAHLWQH